MFDVRRGAEAGAARVVWEEDEDGEIESAPRLVKGEKKKPPAVLKLDEVKPETEAKMQIEAQAEAAVAEQLDATRKAAFEAIKTRDVSAFGAKAELVGEKDLKIILTDEKGETLKRHQIKLGRTDDDEKKPAHTVVEKEATLEDYLPQLKKMKIHIRMEPEFSGKGVRMERVNKENILWLPGNLTQDQVAAQIPEIIRVVVAESLSGENKKVDTARDKVKTTGQALEKEHSAHHREEKLHPVEKKLVEAEQARLHKVESEIKAVLAGVMAEQHIDLAAPEGGQEAWVKKMEARVDASLQPDWSGAGKGGLVFGARHPKYEGASGFVQKMVESSLVHPILTDQQMIRSKFEKIREDVEALPDEGVWNSWRKSGVMKVLRNTTELARLGWQGPKHAALKPVGYGLAVATGFGATLWDITNIWPFSMAKEEVKSWGQWAFGLVGVNLGGKKSGGGGEHH